MSAESIIAILFKKEEDALHAELQLHKLNDSHQVSLGKLVIIRKKADGEFESLKSERNGVGKDTFIGFAIGSLVTMLAGPIGFMVGMLTGTAAGAAVGYAQTDIDKSFVERVKAQIHEGDIVLIANCEEHSSTALDETMQNYTDAKLFRTTV